MPESSSSILPAHLAPILRHALAVVRSAVPAERAAALLAAYGAPVDGGAASFEPELRGLLSAPLREHPAIAAALTQLGLEPAENAEALHARSWLAGSIAPLGLSAFQRADLLALHDRADQLEQLAPWLIHEQIPGLPRPWAGGWPCWTGIEAAITAVHLRVAPTDIFPTATGRGLAAYRHFALIGAHLASWIGDEAVEVIARRATGPDDGWGERVGRIVALADLQAWLDRGGAYLGPAWTPPMAWVKLIDAACGGGDHGLPDRIDGEVSPATARATPDLLRAALAIPWARLPSWSRPVSAHERRRDLERAVAAMFVEDIRRAALQPAPSDPPGSVLELDVEACTLAARPRAHWQYTEPATWLVTPSWCAELHRRGLRRVTVAGCAWERQRAIVDAIAGLDGAGPLPAHVHLDLDPQLIPTPASDRQLRRGDVALVLGADLGLAAELTSRGVRVVPPPLGWADDPIRAARALAACCDDVPLDPADIVLRQGGWTGRWHDHGLSFPQRSQAILELQRRLTRARRSIPAVSVVVLVWRTASAPIDGDGEVTPRGDDARALTVDEITDATRDAIAALRQQVGATPVIVCIDPARGPDPIADRRSKATLTLAAEALEAEGLVVVFPLLELMHDGLRDHAWWTDGRPTEAAWDHLWGRLRAAWVAPVDRDRAEPWPNEAEVETSESFDDPPVQPPVDGGVAAALPAAHAMEALLAARAVATDLDDEAAWAARLEDVIVALPPLPEGAPAHLHALTHLAAVKDDLLDPDGAIAGAYARVLRALLGSGRWEVAALAPLLRLALTRHWIDHLEPELDALDDATRADLGAALLGDGPRPRRGQIPRTPLARALRALLGEG